MGWRGTLRTVTAVARAAERDAQRRHKRLLKERITAFSETAVDDWKNYIRDLVSVHTNLAEPINWHDIAQNPEPQRPVRGHVRKDAARSALDDFKPSIFDFFQGGSSKIRHKLELALAEAPGQDLADYEAAIKVHEAAVEEWNKDTQLAKRVLTGDYEALAEVIDELQTLSGEDLIGTTLALSVSDKFVHAKPHVHTDEVVPNYRRRQLASGKLSETKMPVGQFNELYQDYVASVALRIAGDLFNILPLDEVYVTCMTEMLNTQTGHQELSPILSVQFVRRTFGRLNLEAVDPSDSLENFNHAISFKKTKGFEPIEPLKPVD